MHTTELWEELGPSDKPLLTLVVIPFVIKRRTSYNNSSCILGKLRSSNSPPQIRGLALVGRDPPKDRSPICQVQGRRFHRGL